ncbi:hypothetical protein AB3S75_002969 [Citrus x aurantiifolia]
MQGSMFLFGSALPSEAFVRLPDRSFHLQPVHGRLSSSTKYAAKGIKFIIPYTENKIVNVRFPEKSFQPVVPTGLSWSRNYAAKDIESPKDCSVIEESFLTGFMQQVKNPKCEPDEYGIKYLPVMRQAMCIEGRKVGRTAANEDKRIDVLLTEVMEKVGKEGLFIIYSIKDSATHNCCQS